MKIQANNIRPGMVIENEGRSWTVIKTQIVQPGKGGAFIQVEMRDVESGTKTQSRWRTADTVEKLDVRQIDCTYLFEDESGYNFMDKETFDQFFMPVDAVGEKGGYLQDGMEVVIDTIEGKPVSVQLPQTVVVEVIQADPVVKGQTASSSYKPGMLANGMRIMIPPHIEAPIKIVVNTESGEYVERFKG
ncbi:elongation factor P [Insolitispirillum peregrinum]|uniref:Elongation factor P n=1 Tax=Insolitispirillum peregrinum TaxID=80876 RepID=A0A1N7IXU6_9PROT|nr:elongation factor P [Insolitispirillum peregrinum]SIS41913.1 translation elongation factor P (EF-P) [Insolitispirillum peregrinum]